MHKRDVHEIALDQTQLLIKLRIDHLLRYLPCQRVGRKGARGVAEHIAGKLIQDQDKCHTAPRHLRPVGELTLSGQLIVGLETLNDLPVEVGILNKPARGVFFKIGRLIPDFAKPEGQDFFDVGHARTVPAGVQTGADPNGPPWF